MATAAISPATQIIAPQAVESYATISVTGSYDLLIGADDTVNANNGERKTITTGTTYNLHLQPNQAWWGVGVLGTATYTVVITSLEAPNVTLPQIDTLTGSITRTATFIVAASNSSAARQAQADYVCTGTNDHVIINSAIAALPSVGGHVHLTEGTFTKAGPIVNNADNVILSGEGRATYVTEAASTAPSAGLLVGYALVTSAVTLNQTPTTIPLGSAGSLYASSGTVYAYAVPGGVATTVTYTGVTGNTLTGCTIVTGTVTLTANYSVAGVRVVSGFSLRDIVIDGNWNNATSGGAGVGVLVSGTLFQAANVEARTFQGDGWFIQAFDAATAIFEILMHNCYGRANGGAQIHIGSTVDNSEFIRCFPVGANARSVTTPTRGTHGFSIDGGGCKLVACHAYYNINDGFHISASASSITIVSGESETNDAAGVNVVAATRVNVDDLHLYANNGNNLLAQSSASDVNFVNCKHYLPGTSIAKLVLITTCTKCRVEGNQFNATGGSSVVRGIAVEASSSACEISGNTFKSLPAQTGNIYDIAVLNSNRNNVHDNSILNGILESGTSARNNFGYNTPDGTTGTTSIVVAGTYSSNTSPVPINRSSFRKPTAATAETIERTLAVSSNAALTTATLLLQAIVLPEGLIVNAVNFLSASTPLSGTSSHSWGALYDNNLGLLGQSTDNTSPTWAANTVLGYTLATAYTTTYTGLFYVGIMIVSSGLPSLRGATPISTAVGLAPALCGTSTAALTTTAPSTAGAIVALSMEVYAYTS